MDDIIQFVDKSPPPPLLPILRSRQQAELLTLLLGDPALETSISELSHRTGIPYASVHREIERAEATGLLTSRRVGRTRLLRADPASPYFLGLSEVLVRAFGVPRLLADALADVDGITEAFVFGSWAARYHGVPGSRPVGDIDLLVLGAPDRDVLYAAIGGVEPRLGRPVGVTIRETGWLDHGAGAFHDTVAGRPLVAIPLQSRVLPVAEG